MIMWPHHMAPSEHGHERAGMEGLVPSNDGVSPLKRGGVSLWQYRAGLCGDVQIFNNWQDCTSAHQLPPAMMRQARVEGAEVHGT